MTTTNKGTPVDNSNLLPGELIHIELLFYKATNIRGLTSMITVIYARTRMLWVFPTASKRAPFRIIRLILTTPKNEKHLYKCIRVDDDSALVKSTDVTNLIIE